MITGVWVFLDAAQEATSGTRHAINICPSKPKANNDQFAKPIRENGVLF